MEQLTLEQAALKYDTDNFSYPTPGSNVIIPETTARQWNINAFTAGAEWQKEQSKISALLSALKAIAMGAGNLPDDRLTSKTGPNDAALRGSMLIRMRQIAIDTIQLLEPDFKPLQD
jgi:hypothetical protein